MRRTKQVQVMVDEMNEILKRRKVVEQDKDEDFVLFSDLLIKAGCYKGFNWMYEYSYTDVAGKTTMVEHLCGTGDPVKVREMNGYVQFY